MRRRRRRTSKHTTTCRSPISAATPRRRPQQNTHSCLRPARQTAAYRRRASLVDATDISEPPVSDTASISVMGASVPSVDALHRRGECEMPCRPPPSVGAGACDTVVCARSALMQPMFESATKPRKHSHMLSPTHKPWPLQLRWQLYGGGVGIGVGIGVGGGAVAARCAAGGRRRWCESCL
jgi:hypothetical protein